MATAAAANLLYCAVLEGTADACLALSFYVLSRKRSSEENRSESRMLCLWTYIIHTHTQGYLAAMNTSSVSLRSHQKPNIFSIELTILACPGYFMLACEHIFNLACMASEDRPPFRRQGMEAMWTFVSFEMHHYWWLSDTTWGAWRSDLHRGLQCVSVNPLWQRSGTQPRRKATKNVQAVWTTKQSPLEKHVIKQKRTCKSLLCMCLRKRLAWWGKRS